MIFQLDKRLEKDCFKLAETEHCLWLLLNNKYFPWFIIVPKTETIELFQLSSAQQLNLQKETNLLSAFIQYAFTIDKLNIASIGNIVQQMHVHIIGRSQSDLCWPGVVWGCSHHEEYPHKEAQEIKEKLMFFCKEQAFNNIQYI
ncbi:histidine triad (HIT) protein [Psychromonas sp. CNPT3]|uniref:HIT family protein n=1 Tax=Psychromonas sp. CNPT3 TaxID=314282 RepID=UPI00006E5084|nr:HIT family protein [Psychromonas sp. CNPT3]AGH82493.1 histidine triad (HIT) protein [Psychromonas sp. CNPT3]